MDVGRIRRELMISSTIAFHSPDMQVPWSVVLSRRQWILLNDREWRVGQHLQRQITVKIDREMGPWM